MATERRVVDQCNVITDQTIVSDMDADHEKSIGAHGRYAASHDCPTVHCHVLTNDIAWSHRQTGRLALVTGMLRRPTQGGERVDDTAVAYFRVPFDHHMSGHPNPRAQTNIGADDTVRANADVFTKTRRRVDEGRGMDRDQFGASTSIAAKSASATTTSPTIALPVNFTTLARARAT